MELAIEEAIRFPYQHGQWKKTVLVPGIISWIGVAIEIVVMLGLWVLLIPDILTGEPHLSSNPMLPYVNLLSMVIGALIYLIYVPFLLGYFWEALEVLKRGGTVRDLPEWFESWPRIWFAGLKLYGYKLVIGSPVLILSFLSMIMQFQMADIALAFVGMLLGGIMILLQIVYLFLLPFLIVPILKNSPDCPFRSLFNFSQMMTVGKAHYNHAALALFLCFLIGVGYLLGGIVVSIVTCCIGYLLLPFIYMPLMLSMAPLLVQAYREEDGEPLPLEGHLP